MTVVTEITAKPTAEQPITIHWRKDLFLVSRGLNWPIRTELVVSKMEGYVRDESFLTKEVWARFSKVSSLARPLGLQS